MLKLLCLAFILTCVSGTGEDNKNRKEHISALEEQAVSLLTYLHHADSNKKAVALLNEVTTIDSNKSSAYFNKLIFLHASKQTQTAVEAIEHLIRLHPDENEMYLLGGFLYRELGDHVKADRYFQTANKICTQILDTMSKSNIDYPLIYSNNQFALNRMEIHVNSEHDFDFFLKRKAAFETQKALAAIMKFNRAAQAKRLLGNTTLK